MKLRSLIIRLQSIEIFEIPYRIFQFFTAFVLDPISILVFRLIPAKSTIRNIEFHSDWAINDFHNGNYTLSILQLEIEDIFDIKNWRRDYLNNIDSELKYYFLIDKQNYNLFGDIKYVWELSRFYHLPILAINSVQNHDKELANKIQNQLKEWINQNPYLMTINWKSGIEIGIRLINWSISISILNKKGYLNESFKNIYRKSVFEHAYYLKFHLSKYSSANNHLIAELVGLMFAGHHLGNKIGDKWFDYAYNELAKQIDNQFMSDGGNREQAIHYHTLTLDLYQVAYKLLQNRGEKISENLSERIEIAGDFLENYFKHLGANIEFGDSDSSFVLYNPFDKDFDHYESVITTSSIEFSDKRTILTKNKRIDFRNQLFYSNKKLNKINYKQLKGEKSFSYKYLEDSGYFFIKNKKTKVVFDVGFLGMGKMAAHGHADALHVSLSMNNQPILVDPGTYQYHRKYEKWRNYFRSTAAHNTITINGMSQAELLGRMNWGKRYNVNIEEVYDSNDKFIAVASHDGYKSQKTDVFHRRRVIVNKESDVINIDDDLKGKEEFQYDFHLHFHPSVTDIELLSNMVVIKTGKQKLVIENERFKNAKLFYADKSIPLGWYSPNYDELIPTNTLKLQGNCTEFHSLKTKIYKI